MKIVRYFHNKMNHKAVIHHGQVLSLQTDLSVLQVLGLPRKERDSIEGASGRFLKAPMGLYPYAPTLDGEDLQALELGGKAIAGENLFGSGAHFPLAAQGKPLSCEVMVVGVKSSSSELLGHVIVANIHSAGESQPIASVLGPYITTVDEIQAGQSLDLEIAVHGSGSLDSLIQGDRVTASSPVLGQLDFSLAGS